MRQLSKVLSAQAWCPEFQPWNPIKEETDSPQLSSRLRCTPSPINKHNLNYFFTRLFLDSCVARVLSFQGLANVRGAVIPTLTTRGVYWFGSSFSLARCPGLFCCHTDEVQAITTLIEKQAQIVVKPRVVSEEEKQRKAALLAQYADVTDEEEYPFWRLSTIPLSSC